jgi:hypothetical protein
MEELLGENCISIEDHREIPMLSKELSAINIKIKIPE